MEDYPRTLAEFEARFSTEDACLEYLSLLRWPNGFICPRCGGAKGWRVRKLIQCSSCSYQVSITAGTVFHATRKPLTIWFRAIWWVTSQKTGASALGLQRVLGLGSYETAWVWLHKLRRAMVRPGRDRLAGCVEVDESYVGGERHGKRGRGASGKSLVVIMTEVVDDHIGRIRLRRVTNASSDRLQEAVVQAVAPGSVVQTDGWKGYLRLDSLGYAHEVVRHTEEVGDNLLPHCHRVASLLKRWMLGTHQGAISHEHLDYYLDEYTFRFNRRTSRHRGKLFYRLVQQAVATEPVSHTSMVRQHNKS